MREPVRLRWARLLATPINAGLLRLRPVMAAAVVPVIGSVWQLMVAGPAFARLSHEDAFGIDPVDRRTPEMLNDIISYRYPKTWDQAYDQSLTGMRTSAGSLDIRRFHFLQEFKITSSPEEDLVFGFRSQREENLTAHKNLQEIRVTTSMDPLFKEMTLLGDCGYDKEYGDLGFELLGFVGKQVAITYRFWAVDLYYNSKKEEGEDYRSRMPLSHELRVQGRLSEDTNLELFAMVDTPVDWMRLSHGYRYTGDEKVYGLRIGLPVSFHTALSGKSSPAPSAPQSRTPWTAGLSPGIQLSALRSLKSESVNLLEGVTQDGLPTRSLRPRRLFPASLEGLRGGQEGLSMAQKIKQDLMELSFDQLIFGEDFITTGLFLLSEKTLRTIGGPREGLPEALSVLWDKDPVTRELRWAEAGFYGFYVHQDRTWERYRWHHGWVLNYQQNNFLSNQESLEVKYVAAVEITFSQEARFYLNSTWDLDQVVHDFPFHRRSFRPWGGGNLQGIVVF